MLEWLKRAVVRSPLEGAAVRARRAVGFARLARHPEQYELWAEEARIARFVRSVVGESSRCVDVGCHLGIVLSQIVRRAPGAGHLAFEPDPNLAAWLRLRFPEVDVRQVALGDTPGEATFYVLDERSGFSGLRDLSEPGESVGRIVVEVGRLDDQIGPEGRVDFLKIVVEGAELSMLRGAARILGRDRPFLLFECIPSSLARFGDGIADLFGFLTVEHRYRLFLLKDYLAGGPPLDFPRFEDATRYPFKAFKFAAVPAN